MLALVTGATGFLGSHLVEALRARGDQVRALVRPTSDTPWEPTQVEICRGGLDPRSLVSAARGVDVVFHCAASTDADAPLEALLVTNRDGTAKVCQACLESGVGRLVHISSASVISGDGDPPFHDDLPYAPFDAYGVSKVAAERVVFEFKSKGLNSAIIRPCHIFGRGDPLMDLFQRIIKLRLPLPGSGGHLWQMVYIDNLVQALLLAADSTEPLPAAYTITDRECLSIGQIFATIAGALGNRPPRHLSDQPFLWLYRLYRRSGLNLPAVDRKLRFLLTDTHFNTDKSASVLGYRPRTSTREGLERLFF